MTIQAYPNLCVFPRIKPHAKRLPERVQTVPLQEQFTGPLPPWDERPAAACPGRVPVRGRSGQPGRAIYSLRRMECHGPDLSSTHPEGRLLSHGTYAPTIGKRLIILPQKE